MLLQVEVSENKNLNNIIQFQLIKQVVFPFFVEKKGLFLGQPLFNFSDSWC